MGGGRILRLHDADRLPNTPLILGPRDLRFGDDWRMDLPVDVNVVSAGLPKLMWAWPP